MELPLPPDLSSKTLEDLASRLEGDVRLVKTEPQAPVLIEDRTPACRAALEGPLTTKVEAPELVSAVAQALHSATSAKVPGGFVGSCLPDEASRRYVLPDGLPLMAALSRLVAAAPGAAWIAVEQSDGECAFGVIQVAVSQALCRTEIGVVK